MSGIDGYARRYLAQWEKRATVRTMARFLPDGLGADDLFPASAQPLIRHPEIVARGPDAIRTLLVHTGHMWMASIADLEMDLISRLCGKLARGSFSFSLPEAVRQVALTVATDEAYHAFAAREFMERTEQITGIAHVPLAGREHSALNALEALVSAVPAELVPEAEIVALCFCEHFVTGAMFDLAPDEAADMPFQRVMREHLRDEGRHQIFFERLLAHLWREIGAERRLALGAALPAFFDAFFFDPRPFTAGFVHQLAQIGYGPEEAERIIRETFTESMKGWSGRKTDLPFVGRALELVHAAKLDRDEATRDILVASGWLVLPEAQATPA